MISIGLQTWGSPVHQAPHAVILLGSTAHTQQSLPMTTLHLCRCLLADWCVCVCVCADVGFKLGANVGVKSLVLQLHYGDLSKPGQADTSALTLTVTKKR